MKDFKLLNLNKYSDSRGWFAESFNEDIEKQIGVSFVQDNFSYSKKNVIRGMHYQWDKPMGKLVFCSFGEIMDVIVDIRPESTHFGKSYYFILGPHKMNALWVPPGFAHGFQVMSEKAIVSYKCSEYYNKNGESGINPFDKDLKILWNYPECKIKGIHRPILSEKDENAMSFADYVQSPKF